MRILDLFSGIGGFSLGLERAGMQTMAFCEIEPFCQAVLKKHWPNVPIFDDITKLTGKDIEAIGGCELICGGFPCQDISTAGKGAGIEGARSGLWKEYARLIGEIRPRWVVVENVSALRSRGLGTVLSDLAALRYDAEWHCIPASAIGAPHRRDRIWILAYSDIKRYGAAESDSAHLGQAADGPCGASSDNSARREAESIELAAEVLANPDSQGLEARKLPGILAAARLEQFKRYSCQRWLVEPALGRVADGFPSRVDQLKAFGNAVVPQIPEIIGKAIIEYEQGLNAAN